jgi:MFS family permease
MKFFTLLAMTLGFVVVQLDVIVVNVATRSIGNSIGGSISGLVSTWAAGASIALAVGPIIGGILISSLGWRSIFYINLPLGGLGIWLTKRYAKETPGSPGKSVDIKGQITAIFSLVLLAASLIQGGKKGWTDHLVIAIFAGNICAPRLSALIGAKWLIIGGELMFLAGCILLKKLSYAAGYYACMLGRTVARVAGGGGISC